MFIAEPLVPPSPCPRDHFSTEDCREGTRRSEVGDRKAKERDFFFSTLSFRFCFAMQKFNWGSKYILVAFDLDGCLWIVAYCFWNLFFEGNLIFALNDVGC